MPLYRLAGQEIFIRAPMPELASFETGEKTEIRQAGGWDGARLVSRARGWVANAEREAETYRTEQGFLIQVEGCGGFFVSADGALISPEPPTDAPSELQRQALLSVAFVFALALKNVWSLHCGAAMFNGRLTVFLGESGMGKSTLSSHLSKQSGWRRVADDLLPVKMENGLQAFPRFPQLKLKAEEQPARTLPESLTLNAVCLLQPAAAEAQPELRKMSPAQTAQAFLAHTAGTRLLGEESLAKHLRFSTEAAAQVAAYQLVYPHRREALPTIKELLEQTC